jgi:cytochrome c oxidase subunit 2
MLLLLFVAYADSSENWQLGFQDCASPTMEGLIEFHHDLFFFLLIVMGFVFWFLFRILCDWTVASSKQLQALSYGTIVEIIWTLIPAILLLFVSLPSFTLLYALDELIDPMLTLKVIGKQWFWTYEYSDYTATESSFVFDSYLIEEFDLNFGSLRLLEVDRRVVLPIHTYIRILVSSSDVLHSWAVPSFGIKIDACPGRLNQLTLFINRCGIFYGQCSELCGVNHGFMPIVIEGVSFADYAIWLYACYSREA